MAAMVLFWIVLAFALPFGVFFFLPKALCEVTRCRLADLADDLTDDVLNGRLPNAEVTLELLNRIEMSSRWARMTRPSVVALQLLTDQEGTAQELEARIERVGALRAMLEPESQELFRDREDRFNRIMIVHIFRDSPSGWFAAVAFIAFALRHTINRSNWRHPLQHLKNVTRPYRRRLSYGAPFGHQE